MYANDIALVHIVEDGPPRTATRRRSARSRSQGRRRPTARKYGSGWGKTLPSKQCAERVLLKVDLK